MHPHQSHITALTFLEISELEIWTQFSELGITGRLLELAVGLGRVKLTTRQGNRHYATSVNQLHTPQKQKHFKSRKWTARGAVPYFTQWGKKLVDDEPVHMLFSPVH